MHEKVELKILQETLAAVELTNISGLPVSHGTVCKIFLLADKFLFEYNEEQLELPLTKLKNVHVQFENDGLLAKEAKKRYGLIEGSVGISPRMLNIYTKWRRPQLLLSVESFLVFEYEKDNSIDYLVFDASDDIVYSQRIVGVYKNQLG